MSFFAFSNYLEISKPAILILPLVGLTSNVKLLNVVLFPAPLTPRSAKHSPILTEKDKLFTAINLYDLQNCSFYYNSYTFLNSVTSIASGFSSLGLDKMLYASFTTSSSMFVIASSIIIASGLRLSL